MLKISQSVGNCILQSCRRSTSSLRWILRLRWCWRPILQPSSAVNPPAVPSTNLRLASDIASFGGASDRHPTLIGVVLSGSAFSSSFGLRRRPTLQPCLPTQPQTFVGCCVLLPGLPVNLRLAPPANSPALPSNPTSDSHRLLHLRLRLPVSLRLAPAADPPALPSNSTSGFHRLLHPPSPPSG
jgi:hypothetical protein